MRSQRFSVMVLAVGWLWASPAAAGDFEGVVRMKTTLAGMETASATDWYIKGDLARMERPREGGQAHATIIDGQKRSMVMLMPEKKLAMEFNLDETAESVGQHMKDEVDKTLVERTGRTDKIAGYSCEVWKVSDKETKELEFEVCVTKGFGKAATAWLDPKRLQQSSQPAWVKQLMKEGGFGLRTVHYGGDGKESSRTEAVAIEKKSLDAKLFVVPPDYTRQNMNDMANRMKAAQAEKEKSRGARQGAGGEGQAQPDVNELMKKFGEMMKKQQPPQGGQ